MSRYTLVKDGRRVAHVSVARPGALDRYRAKGLEVVEGEEPLDPVLLTPEQEWDAVRARRNGLILKHAWTVANHSPLSAQNMQEWLAYLQALHEITKDKVPGDEIVWPEPPGLEYA